MTSVICKLLLHLAGGAEKHFEITTEKKNPLRTPAQRQERLPEVVLVYGRMPDVESDRSRINDIKHAFLLCSIITPL